MCGRGRLAHLSRKRPTGAWGFAASRLYSTRPLSEERFERAEHHQGEENYDSECFCQQFEIHLTFSLALTRY